MSRSKFYCLKCNQTNACKCGNEDNMFSFSHKLRPPKDLKNKMEWRTFLKTCPQFINMIPQNLLPKMKELMEYVKYPHLQEINGRKWKEWDIKTINASMEENKNKILNLLNKYGYKLEDPEKLIKDTNYNYKHVEHSLTCGDIPYLINEYKYERIDVSNVFIKKLNESFNDDNRYSSIKDKYTNGDCESLVSELYRLNNNKGELFEISQETMDGKVHHYVYKLNNRFYDINGEHFDTYSIMKKINFFDEHSECNIKKMDNILTMPKINIIEQPKLNQLKL